MQLGVASPWYNHKVSSEQVKHGHPCAIVHASSFVPFPKQSYGYTRKKKRHQSLKQDIGA